MLDCRSACPSHAHVFKMMLKSLIITAVKTCESGGLQCGALSLGRASRVGPPSPKFSVAAQPTVTRTNPCKSIFEYQPCRSDSKDGPAMKPRKLLCTAAAPTQLRQRNKHTPGLGSANRSYSSTSSLSFGPESSRLRRCTLSEG